MDIATALRGTHKGRLSYDRRNPTKEFFEECSTTPALSSRYHYIKSPDNNNLQTLHKTNRTNSGSYDNVIQLTMTSTSSSRKVEVVSPTTTTARCRDILPVSPEYTKSILAVKQYEDSLEKEKNHKVHTKQKQFTEYIKNLQSKAENRLLSIERNQITKAREQQQETELQFMQQSVELQEKQKKLKEDHRQHAQMLQKKQEKLKEEVKRKEKERQDRIQLTQTIQNDIGIILNKLKNMYEQASQKERLPDSVKKGLDLVNHKYAQASYIASRDLDVTDLQKMTEMLKLCLNAHEFMKKEFDELAKTIKEETAEAEKKAKEEAEKKRKEEAQAKAEADAKTQLVPPTPGLDMGPSATSTPGLNMGPSATSTPAPSSASTMVRFIELRCVEEHAFIQYKKLQDQLKKAEEDSKSLFNDPQLKKMKFDIQKAVNNTINNISPVSGDHLRDKLQRLQNLLSGKTVDLSGRSFSISGCPRALPFCKYLIAKMIVIKGEEMVSAKHSSAFAIAAVTVGLISDHPDLIPLLLGHFNRLCPYTVPYHVNKEEGQSMEDYLKALGYTYDSDGNAEKQDLFLKRMSGIMRLYTSIMVSHPPRGPNPYGTEHAWAWLSMVMNIEPLPDITATMIFDLLEVTGHALYRDYRKQFVKLLHVLIKEFLPKLKNLCSNGGAPMTRLEDFLQTSVKHNGNIAPPEGLLNAHFWMS